MLRDLFAFVIEVTQVEESLFRFTVYDVHMRDLLHSFRHVGLVDTNGIDPKSGLPALKS